VYFNDPRIVGMEGINGTVLEGHAIPMEIVNEQFSREKYEEFLEARKMNLLIKIEEAVESRVLPET
jgi:hypothetical protein